MLEFKCHNITLTAYYNYFSVTIQVLRVKNRSVFINSLQY